MRKHLWLLAPLVLPVLTTGCSPGIVNEWVLDHTTVDGEIQEYPYTMELTEFDRTHSAALSIRSDKTITLAVAEKYDWHDGGKTTDIDEYPGTWTKQDGSYQIDYRSTSGDTLTFVCALIDEALRCDDEWGTQVWVPAE